MVYQMNKFPSYSKLSESDKQVIANIKNKEDIEDAIFDNEWIDDNALCFSATINGVQISFWWIDLEYASSIFCWDKCIICAEKLIYLLNDQVDSYLDELKEV